MGYAYEELAQYFADTPLALYGVYRTQLEANRIYGGHVDKPTAKCGVIIALDGEAEFIFDEEERYLLAPGKVLIGGAGRRLEILSGEQGFRYCLAHYLPIGSDLDKDNEVIGQEGRPAGGAAGRQPRDIAVLEAALAPDLLRLVDGLIEADSSPDFMSLLEKKSIFYQIVAKLLQSERHGQNKESYPVIEDAVLYIQTHFMESITLAMLAERYKLKSKYFSHLFTKYTGTGPIDYLIHYRMNKAQEWLQTKQFTVSAVARSVGYADPYYFSRLFKKYKGIAPSQVGLSSRELER
ncbi:AraC-type DNA-binding protein [Paenibacillus algorifonticola]|uniref:AraC-type DNA-binding protein n=1 Tax=Paenibacillus algorifonticola TaxID=684063 RepID=A0A1I2IZ41_9BACL|nr:AraC family transcriptional regulator [Paenibacillus algorifonticola]SFF47449.1 AraC-type DNA-binding protein [Paenibacillus algorifonticola]